MWPSLPHNATAKSYRSMNLRWSRWIGSGTIIYVVVGGAVIFVGAVGAVNNSIAVLVALDAAAIAALGLMFHTLNPQTALIEPAMASWGVGIGIRIGGEVQSYRVYRDMMKSTGYRLYWFFFCFVLFSNVGIGRRERTK